MALHVALAARYLNAHVPHKVSRDGVPCALVHNFHADCSAAFGLQSVP